jgi:large subunit ribosomal protein L17
MRHRNANRKLSRNPSHRRAMLRNLVTSLLEHEEVRTTTAKAKEVRRLAERMITLGKRGTLASRRRALETIRSKTVAQKLFDQLAPRYGARPGGYTRIYKLGPRHGDNAEMSLIQLVDMVKPTAGADAGT